MYTNRIQRDTVGKQTPLSTKSRRRGKIKNQHSSGNLAAVTVFFEVKMAVGSEKRKSAENLRPTCVPDVLDPYVGAGSKKQPLDRDEEKADDV